jgi:hypothetical protein
MPKNQIYLLFLVLCFVEWVCQIKIYGDALHMVSLRGLVRNLKWYTVCTAVDRIAYGWVVIVDDGDGVKMTCNLFQVISET